MHAERRIPVSRHRRLALFKNTLLAAPAAKTGWLTSWNSTAAPGISPEELRISSPTRTSSGCVTEDKTPAVFSIPVMFMHCRAKAGAANNAATTVESANFFTLFSFKACVQTRISTSRETLRKYQNSENCRRGNSRQTISDCFTPGS
jgi:hypothetical protein